MFDFPAPGALNTPVSNLQYARSYVFDQPYVCVVSPAEALRIGTLFPYLLATYAPSLKKADRGEDPWTI